MLLVQLYEIFRNVSEFSQEYSWNADANQFWKYLDVVHFHLTAPVHQNLYYIKIKKLLKA